MLREANAVKDFAERIDRTMSGGGIQEPKSSAASAPGKLYIAGEYAVVEHGHPAILVAVDRMLTVRITEHDTSADQAQPFGVDPVGRIHSAGHPEASVTWRRRAGRAVPDLEQPGAAFVLAVIHAVEELAQQQSRALKVYDVNIESELDDASGSKYGLGSSAAVTVAMVKALTSFYELELTPIQQYKLAFVAASRAQKVGSGGDLAASLLGGCIRFTAVDRQWVTNRLQDTALSALIDMPWPGLSIARLRVFEPSSTLRLMVGWTGSPASTSSLVGHVQQQSAAEHERMYQDFLTGSDACVDALAQALAADDEQAVIACVRQARKLLQELSLFTGVTIETPSLRNLIDVAERHGAAAKSSGAGGGDCGIAIAGPGADAAAIRQGWQQKDIVPLDLSVQEPQLELADWAGSAVDDGAGRFPATAVTDNAQSRAGADNGFADSCDGVRDTAACNYATSGRFSAAQVNNETSRSQTVSPGSNRKDDHIRLALDEYGDMRRNAFDDLAFVHHSLGSIAVEDVDMSTQVCGVEWDVPFYINAMTGGSAKAEQINTSLARVASATGLAMASGSQHAAIRDPRLEPTFTTIREHNAAGFVFANVGATVDVSQALHAVEMLHANALQIHLNAAQELVMPEGSRDFESWPQHIKQIVEASPVPVVVKEVGFGMSAQTVRQLAQMGVRCVDVSGRGGTDFARIENARRQEHEYGYLAGWGQSTALCLLELLPNDSESTVDSQSAANTESTGGAAAHTQVLASGGVRNPLDVVKALTLGAEAVGVSGHFLHVLNATGEDGLTAEINGWKEQVRSLMALLGARTVADLRHTDLLVTGTTAEESRLLGVAISVLAHRSRTRSI